MTSLSYMVHRVSAIALVLALCTAAAVPFAHAQTTTAPTTAPTTATPAMAGGWTKVDITTTESALLQRALTNVASYRADVKARVCVVEVRSGTKQVVAGTNYRFVVQACAVSSDQNVGVCAAKGVMTTASVCSEYTIRVFEPLGADAFEVTAIDSLSSAAPANSSPGATTDSSKSNSTSDDVGATKTPTVTNAPTTTNSPTTLAPTTPAPTTPAPTNAAVRVLAGSVTVAVAAVLASFSV